MATVAKAVIQRGHFLLRDRSNRTNSADSKKTQKKPDSVAKMTVKKSILRRISILPPMQLRHSAQ